LRGAGPAAFTINPDVAVIVDCTTAADIVNTPPEKQVCNVGDGAVVSFMDKATLYDAELYFFIRHLADQAGILNQTKNVIAGGNDAGSIQKSAGGVKVAAVSLPCRYIHSAVGAVHMQDIESTQALLLLLKKELVQ
jgi:endoglucanase